MAGCEVLDLRRNDPPPEATLPHLPQRHLMVEYGLRRIGQWLPASNGSRIAWDVLGVRLQAEVLAQH